MFEIEYLWRIQTGGGRQTLSLGQNLLYGKIFAENWMKMKEIGLRERCTSLTHPLDPSMMVAIIGFYFY